jgi:hypothetical protein
VLTRDIVGVIGEHFSDNWFELALTSAHDRWKSTTGHDPEKCDNAWAAEIAKHCQRRGEHLSLPCSLIREGNEIICFLNSVSSTIEPSVFFRLYLILLSEFCGQLKDISGVLRFEFPKTPSLVSIWSQRWAKHRLRILVQHHPLTLFADQYGQRWQEVEVLARGDVYRTENETDVPIIAIDTDWFRSNPGRRPGFEQANTGGQAIVFMPHMLSFLDETIDYYRAFIDKCIAAPEKVRQFESIHYRR